MGQPLTPTVPRNYTQNIDTLEMVAGISNCIQCHGSFETASCLVCKHQVPAAAIEEAIFAQRIPVCPVCPPPDPRELAALGAAGEDAAAAGPAHSPLGASAAAAPAAGDSRRPPEGEECGDSGSGGSDKSGGSGESDRSGGSGGSGVSDRSRSLSSPYSQAVEDEFLRQGGESPDLEQNPGQGEGGLRTPSHNSQGVEDAFLHSMDPVPQPPKRLPIMKPDIVFFGEDLPAHFYGEHSMAIFDHLGWPAARGTATGW